MSEHDETAPDSIWIADVWETETAGEWDVSERAIAEVGNTPIKYLRATPERECAAELLKAIEPLANVIRHLVDNGKVGGIVPHLLQNADDAITKAATEKE